MHTGRRDQLHLSKLDEFAAWAEAQGYRREHPKGVYEVLRLRQEGYPPLIYWTHHTGDHATTDAHSDPLVQRWFSAKRAHKTARLFT